MNDDAEPQQRKRHETPPEPGESAPIFDVEGGALGVNYIVIYRYEPAIDEGMIRKANPDLTEWEIQQKHGGGVYELTGRTATGRIVRGAKKRVTIAGDPILSSATKQEQWARANTIGEVRGASAPTPAQPVGPSFGELVTLITTITQSAQAGAAATHAHQMEQIRSEQARREREGDERADRQRREQTERDDRIRKEAKEADERREKQLEESRERDRQHQKVMLDLVKSGQPAGGGTDVLQTFIAGMTTALKFAGGGRDDDDQGDGEPVDPITAAIQTLPEVVAQIMGGGAKKETEEKPAASPGATSPGAAGDGPEPITLQGSTAAQAAAFVSHFKAQGKDPAALLERAMETMIRSSAKKAAAPTAPVAPDAVIPPAAKTA